MMTKISKLVSPFLNHVQIKKGHRISAKSTLLSPADRSNITDYLGRSKRNAEEY